MGQNENGGFPPGQMRRTHSGDVVGRLSEHLEDVDGGGEILVLEVVQRFGVGSGILFLLNILHHLGLKLGVHRTRLDQGQPAERQTHTEPDRLDYYWMDWDVFTGGSGRIISV